MARTASIKRAWSQWMVVPHDGTRGGIAVASYRDAIRYCSENHLVPVDDNGAPLFPATKGEC